MRLRYDFPLPVASDAVWLTTGAVASAPGVRAQIRQKQARNTGNNEIQTCLTIRIYSQIDEKITRHSMTRSWYR